MPRSRATKMMIRKSSIELEQMDRILIWDLTPDVKNVLIFFFSFLFFFFSVCWSRTSNMAVLYGVGMF